MSTKQQIEKMLNDAFSPRFLEVIDVSDAHYGHAAANPEGESHFEVNIISDAFANKTRIQSHRSINKVLKPLLETTLHALALNVRSK